LPFEEVGDSLITIDPVLLAVLPDANPHLAVIQRSAFCDEGSLFDADFLPGLKSKRDPSLRSG
jgi:hypothetical protein